MLTTLTLALVVAVAKVGVWLVTGSLAVLTQAVDSALDIAALGVVYVGVRVAGKPADDTHHYGHDKAENLAAYTQTLLLGAVLVGVVMEAARRLGGPPSDVEAPWYAFALLALSVVVDVYRVRALTAAARAAGSDALRAGALNIAGDIGTTVLAVGSLVLVRAGLDDADPVGALIVAAVVAVAAVRVGRRSVDVLMDRAPGGPADAIAAAAARAGGVSETRRVRVRGTGHNLFADVTVAAGRTTSLERAHDIAQAVEDEIALVAPGADVIVHVEPASATGALTERVAAAASRTEGVHEVHNVLIHAFNEHGRPKLQVTLHAKVDHTTSLRQAHDLSERIEAEVERELATEVRVDTHIEPLAPASHGIDVTSERADLVAAVRTAALEEPDVLDCHEVLIAAAGGDLAVVAHVRGRQDLALERIHEASQRIEKRLHARFPELGNVLIHFEPA